MIEDGLVTLSRIDGFSQIVLSRYADKLDADGRHALERIRAGSERMGVLIDSMLELSRLGRRPMELRDVDLSALAAEVVEELRAAQPERDVEVLIEPNVSAVGDKELLRVALQNLLANAFKFTSQRPHARVQFGRTELPFQFDELAAEVAQLGVYWLTINSGAGGSAERLCVPFRRGR